MPTDTRLDYFYPNEAEQFSFYRIPKSLFTDNRFRKLSAEAKILYVPIFTYGNETGWICGAVAFRARDTVF